MKTLTDNPVYYIRTINEDLFTAPSKNFQKISFEHPNRIILYHLDDKDGTTLATLEIYRRHIVSIETHYHILTES